MLKPTNANLTGIGRNLLATKATTSRSLVQKCMHLCNQYHLATAGNLLQAVPSNWGVIQCSLGLCECDFKRDTKWLQVNTKLLTNNYNDKNCYSETQNAPFSQWGWFYWCSLPVKREFFFPTVTKCLLTEDHKCCCNLKSFKNIQN